MEAERKESVLLVDGNNILHAWEDLRVLHKTRKGSAHVELCRRLTSFQDVSNYVRIVVVFDGRGARIEEERVPHGIQVFYSDSSRTADDIIERLVHKYAERYTLHVATDDVMEQDAVIAAGAEALSALMLRNLVDQAESEFRSRWKL